MFSAVAIVVCVPLLFLSLSCVFFFNESTASSANSDIRSLDQTYTWSYLRHIFFAICTKLAHDTLSLYVEYAFPGVCSWYTYDKLMVHHQPQHFLPSLHNNPMLSQLCHKLQKRTAVKNEPRTRRKQWCGQYLYIYLTLYCTDLSLHCKREEVWRMGGHWLLENIDR